MNTAVADAAPSAPVSEVAIAARDLSLGYGPQPYVTHLNLEVRRGEILAILGANGAGKTTTIMGLAGFFKPHAGYVEFDGSRSTLPASLRARNGLGVVTQDRCVFMNMTLRENLKAGGVSVEEALQYFPELEEHVNRTVGLLSGGQQQMLAVARAIARKPKVLLADELSLGLAPKIVDRILEVLEQACRTENLGVLLVEQQVVKALSVANRGAVLRRGVLELEGDAADLRSRMDEVQALYL